MKYPRLITENGRKVPQGILYVPTNLEAFHKAKIEAVVVAVICGGDSITGDMLEELQRAFDGALEIFRHPSCSNIVITAELKLGWEKLKNAIEDTLGCSMLKINANPARLEGVAKAELKSSLRNS